MLFKAVRNNGETYTVTLRTLLITMGVLLTTLIAVGIWFFDDFWVDAPKDIRHKRFAVYSDHYANRWDYWHDRPDAFYIRHKDGMIHTGTLQCNERHGTTLLWRSPHEWQTSDRWFGHGGASAVAFQFYPNIKTQAERASYTPDPVGTLTLAKKADYKAEPKRY